MRIQCAVTLLFLWQMVACSAEAPAEDLTPKVIEQEVCAPGDTDCCLKRGKKLAATKQDPHQAAAHLRCACNGGIEKGCLYLAQVLRYSLGGEKETREADQVIARIREKRWPRPPRILHLVADAGAGVVLDRKQKIVWALRPSGVVASWSEAETYCRELDLGGNKDWRLPEYAELASLRVGCDHAEHSICIEYIGPAEAGCYWAPGIWNGPCGAYWTRTGKDQFPQPTYLNFRYGGIISVANSKDEKVESVPVYARCVRSSRSTVRHSTHAVTE